MTVKATYPRKQPLRSCIACRKTTDKASLIRFVRTGDGQVVCDPTGKQAGRGAYLCDRTPCFERAKKSHLLDRALRIKLSDADYERLVVASEQLPGGAAEATEVEMVEEQ